jgi:DNA polymerase III subunit delta'
MVAESILINKPIDQLKLFGFDSHFNLLTKLHENGRLPNTILFTGNKGLGKSTFAYHFINYLFSKNEDNAYSKQSSLINENNSSHKLVKSGSHPNFFLIDNKFSEKDIKIEQIRNLLKFLSKTTYSKNLKVVLIDNAEYLNLNSSNSLLKALEEPSPNTYFFIIHNNTFKILNTIKSRCTEFKFFLKNSLKKEILSKILSCYDIDYDFASLPENHFFDSPGNLVKYIAILENQKIDINDQVSCINYFMELYKTNKDFETLSFISTFINKFYLDLCISNKNKQSYYFLNHRKIQSYIYDIKKYNLSEKNFFITIKNILNNEQR